MVHVGAGLWALRSTARQPASMPVLYARAVEDARFVETLGYDSFWVAEHRFWYDGWCPQPLVLAAALAGATQRLQIGTAVHLLAQHDPGRARTVARTLGRTFPGRIQMGVSLGYRDEEFDGLGLRRQDRARLLEERLDAIAVEPESPPVWVGGMADAAIVRAARRGLSLLLPPTLQQRQVVRAIDVARTAADEAGTTVPHVGMLKDIWIGDESEGLERLRSHYREYVTAWWGLDADGHPDRQRIDAQIERNVRAGAIGSPAKVIEMLTELVAAGVDMLVLQIHMESTRDAYREQLAEAAAVVLPTVRSLPTRS